MPVDGAGRGAENGRVSLATTAADGAAAAVKEAPVGFFFFCFFCWSGSCLSPAEFTFAAVGTPKDTP